jgi:hypothetical protein
MTTVVSTGFDTFKVNHEGSEGFSSLGIYKYSQHRAAYRSFLSHFSSKLGFDWKSFPRTPKQANGDFDVLLSEEVGKKLYTYVTERGRTLKPIATPKAEMLTKSPSIRKTKEPLWNPEKSGEEKSFKEVKSYLIEVMQKNGHPAEDLEDYLVESQLAEWYNKTTYNDTEDEIAQTVVRKLHANMRAVLEGYTQNSKDGLTFTQKGFTYFCNWLKDEDKVYDEWLKLSDRKIFD